MDHLRHPPINANFCIDTSNIITYKLVPTIFNPSMTIIGKLSGLWADMGV